MDGSEIHTICVVDTAAGMKCLGEVRHEALEGRCRCGAATILTRYEGVARCAGKVPHPPTITPEEWRSFHFYGR